MDLEGARRWVLQSMGVTVWDRRDGRVVEREDSRDMARGEHPSESPPEREAPDEILEFRAPEPAVDPESPDPDEIAGMDWAALEAAVQRCGRCPLHTSRTQGVFGVGARDADWMIIGEAPGADEDRRGQPFVGRAGQLLDAMLEAVGLDRERVFIANILKSRPPENRDPHADEIAACAPYLERQIALVRPKLILAVGRIAAQHLLATSDPVGRLRGKVHAYGRAAIPLVATYHPAYLLRQPSAKSKSWQDLRLARRTAAAGLK